MPGHIVFEFAFCFVTINNTALTSNYGDSLLNKHQIIYLVAERINRIYISFKQNYCFVFYLYRKKHTCSTSCVHRFWSSWVDNSMGKKMSEWSHSEHSSLWSYSTWKPVISGVCPGTKGVCPGTCHVKHFYQWPGERCEVYACKVFQ